LDLAVVNQDGFYISTGIWCLWYKATSSKFIILNKGSEILVAMTPTILNTTENAFNRFSPTDRDCYQDGEFKLPTLKENGNI